MYERCLRCERAFGRNTELTHLPIGRRVAFDATTGRLWVICTRCDQWNLTPLEERWEAVTECERIAAAAEAQVSTGTMGLARTTSGFELLRVGGLPRDELANWRYGRAVRGRQLRMVAGLALAAGAAGLVGILGETSFHSGEFGAWSAVASCLALTHVWRRPPRLRLRFTLRSGRRLTVWGWDLSRVRFAWDRIGATLVLPEGGRTLQLRGIDALAALGALLPALDRADAATVDIAAAVKIVDEAEHAERRRARRVRRGLRGRDGAEEYPARPWEIIARSSPTRVLEAMTPERRLALEMAVTEDLERLAMRALAADAVDDWRAADEIGQIADDLLLPEGVAAWIRMHRTTPPLRRDDR